MFRRTDPLARELGLDGRYDGMAKAFGTPDTQLEPRLDALYNTIQSRDERIRELEAHLAAMREALEDSLPNLPYSAHYQEMGECKDCGAVISSITKAVCALCLRKRIVDALAPDAGKTMLERLRKAEEPAIRPALDGNAYGVVVGDNLQDGISGWGETPQEAIDNLHKDCLQTLERLRKAEAEAEYYKQEAQYRWEVLCDAWNRGTELTKKLEKAEAERVEAVPNYGYCEHIGCQGFIMSDEQCHNCDASKMYFYLRANNMIREAE